jgi:hypothetical protein
LLSLCVAGAAAVALAGCGGGSTSSSPDLTSVPMIRGMRVVGHIRRCDRGANPYCAVQVVVVGDRSPSSTRLLDDEAKHLASLGWTQTIGDTGDESGADSPGHKLRLTYATAASDLEGVDLGWITRAPSITHTLSRVMFDRAPAISFMLETGSS